MKEVSKNASNPTGGQYAGEAGPSKPQQAKYTKIKNKDSGKHKTT